MCTALSTFTLVRPAEVSTVLTYPINMKNRKFPIRRDDSYFSALKIPRPTASTLELHVFDFVSLLSGVFGTLFGEFRF